MYLQELHNLERKVSKISEKVFRMMGKNDYERLFRLMEDNGGSHMPRKNIMISRLVEKNEVSIGGVLKYIERERFKYNFLMQNKTSIS